jgi:hypothetical protein
MRYTIDPGTRYGRLTVLQSLGYDKYGHRRVLCRCDCGNEKTTNADRLGCGATKSCGCLAREKHNAWGRNIFRGAKDRQKGF